MRSRPTTTSICYCTSFPPTHKMFARSALRVTPFSSAVARRSFQTSSVRLGSPYHYPEGPRSNIPFNPLTKFFYLRYWGYMATGFGLPFAIAYWQLHKN